MKKLLTVFALIPTLLFAQTPTERQVLSTGTALTRLPVAKSVTVAPTDTVIVFKNGAWIKTTVGAIQGGGYLTTGANAYTANTSIDNTGTFTINPSSYLRVGGNFTAPSNRLFMVHGKSYFDDTLQYKDGTQGANKVLTSDASGNATWQIPSPGWSLTGNSIPPTGINFIGTTDNANLIFKRNNHIVFYSGMVGITNTTYFADSVQFAKHVIFNDTVHSYAPVIISDGTQGANKVLTSDANGLGSWRYPLQTSTSYTFASTTTYTVAAGTVLVLNTNTATVTGDTLDLTTLTASAVNGQIFSVSTVGTVTTLGMKGATIYGKIATISVAVAASWFYSTALTAWIRRQ